MEMMYNLGIPEAGLRVVKFEKGEEDYNVLNEYYEKYIKSQNKIDGEEKENQKEESDKEIYQLVSYAQKLIDEFKVNHDISEKDLDFNFSQSSKEVDEVINTNIKKGESEEMAIKKNLDEKEVADVKPVNYEAEEETEGTIVEETTTEEIPVVEEEVPEVEEPAEEEVEEEAEKEDFEADDKDDKEDDEEDDEKVEEAAEKCEKCGEEIANCKCEKKEECLDMSKADRKTFEARIATLENNLKAVKAELKVAAPYKALYEEAQAKIAELESYKEDVELDRLKADKEQYASTCNFDALEDEDKEKVQEKIDDYKVSVYDFKAFMADVLKRYSRKQVYSNMERIISYFSMDDEEKKADDIDLPSDKSQADRILDKYSDVL